MTNLPVVLQVRQLDREEWYVRTPRCAAWFSRTFWKYAQR